MNGTNSSKSLLAQIKALEEEIARLKEGKFTDEELQNLCHNTATKDLVKFGKGCEEYQKKLFGTTYKSIYDQQFIEAEKLRINACLRLLITFADKPEMYGTVNEVDESIREAAKALTSLFKPLLITVEKQQEIINDKLGKVIP